MTAIDVRLQLKLPPDTRIGPGKVLLLESVAELGSITAAARAQGMTYRRAWELLDHMNKAFGQPVVTGHPGAAGGSELTALGREIVAGYRRLEARMRKLAAPTLAALDARIAVQAGPAPGARRKP